MDIDLQSVTFIGLMTIGFVNVLTFFWKDLDSKMKFGLSALFAFGLTFVPPDMGSIILDKAKIALETALVASGAYKIAQKVGGT